MVSEVQLLDFGVYWDVDIQKAPWGVSYSPAYMWWWLSRWRKKEPFQTTPTAIPTSRTLLISTFSDVSEVRKKLTYVSLAFSYTPQCHFSPFPSWMAYHFSNTKATCEKLNKWVRGYTLLSSTMRSDVTVWFLLLLRLSSYKAFISLLWIHIGKLWDVNSPT